MELIFMDFALYSEGHGRGVAKRFLLVVRFGITSSQDKTIMSIFVRML
jgi:hypothetical protein